MDANLIIQQGEMLKFKVRFLRQDFDQTLSNFYVELLYGMTGGKITIPKEEFMELTDDIWVFSFSTSGMVGPVTARMVMEYTDGDVPGITRPEVDEQIICFVITSPCPRFLTCPACSGTHDVTYERTEASDLVYHYDLMTDLNGHPLLTSDNMYLYAYNPD